MENIDNTDIVDLDENIRDTDISDIAQDVPCENCCSHKTKKRTQEEYRSLINRLNRIEGQVRGVKKMLDTDTYCTDILTQVSAIQAALNAFNRELLSNHIHTCVADDIRNGKDETIDELVLLLRKLMK